MRIDDVMNRRSARISTDAPMSFAAELLVVMPEREALATKPIARELAPALAEQAR